ncbi:hypothetical protein OEA41_003585 [Lepraria neglecta]|uniref:Conserved oligomeric Golgi complex subunit 2 n=1 Tax=Lepraria neglecta TaxID=209136 RepID=A0AAD9Z5X9_9LECA|nr:hypothetical protein OEA41_003585 [Lepraria neglecta]
MSNRFYFDDDDSSASSDDNLPYPKPLTRASFLTPNFDPTTFLSTLHNRHQTLEDLRAELRTRSQDLNKELLDLVNENYQDFLSLGSSLKGGDEKVEEVRLGLLGFRREVEGLRGKVDSRRGEVEGLVGERKRIREQIQVGRQLLEVETKIGELESRLMLASTGARKGEEDGEASDVDDSDEESEEEEEGNGITVSKLRRHMEQYMYIRRLFEKIGDEHPFLVKQEERVLRLKQTVLLDLNSALKQAVAGGEERRGDLLKLLGIYKQMGQANEAMKVLKESKQ